LHRPMYIAHEVVIMFNKTMAQMDKVNRLRGRLSGLNLIRVSVCDVEITGRFLAALLFGQMRFSKRMTANDGRAVI